MMPLQLSQYPFNFHRLGPSDIVAISLSGDFVFLNQSELELLVDSPHDLPLHRLLELKSKFFLGGNSPMGTLRLLASRAIAKKEAVLSGPSLHIFVLTLQCTHTCQYCQVSRTLNSSGYSMSPTQIDAACRTVFESPAQTITVEFQGGDPLLRFDLICQAIERLEELNNEAHREIRFVVATTLHQLTEEVCAYFKAHKVYLSTSIDGPEKLHNRNRPLPTRDSYQRTVAGIELARSHIDKGCVSALMTTTRESLANPEEIVDEYVRLGFEEIFIRPLSPYGFARRNKNVVGYSSEEFNSFYQRAFERILFWNRQNYPLKEVSAAIYLNKILSTFDAGYVNLQSPTGLGLSVLVYNYDGYVYPSDEARMLAETGDYSLRLGKIGQPLRQIFGSKVMHNMVRSSLVNYTPYCNDCAFNNYCGPDPVDAQGQFGITNAPVFWTDHCKRSKWLFDFLFRKLRIADQDFVDLAYRWSQPFCSPEQC